MCEGLAVKESRCTTGSERWVQLEGGLQTGSARRGNQVLTKAKQEASRINDGRKRRLREETGQ